MLCRTLSLSSCVSLILFCSIISFCSYCCFSVCRRRWLFSSSSMSFCLIAISQVMLARSAWTFSAHVDEERKKNNHLAVDFSKKKNRKFKLTPYLSHPAPQSLSPQTSRLLPPQNPPPHQHPHLPRARCRPSDTQVRRRLKKKKHQKHQINFEVTHCLWLLVPSLLLIVRDFLFDDTEEER